MRKILIKVMVLAVMAGAMIGCRSTPVYNVEQQTIVSNGSAKLGDVQKAIIASGASLGWQMKAVKPGHIVGTLYLRDHMAKIDVNYSTKSYSITYKDSNNLNYDGTNIHSNYNGWIQNLQRKIDAYLSAI